MKTQTTKGDVLWGEKPSNHASETTTYSRFSPSQDSEGKKLKLGSYRMSQDRLGRAAVTNEPWNSVPGCLYHTRLLGRIRGVANLGRD